ncbi:MAG: CAP domain-containing protein [Flavobacteriaceae bacterium]|nr:CAP domain-containing protein [Flavobacteriaceae bacterium]
MDETNLVEKNDISLTYSPIENEIISLINDYRASKGLSKLNIFNIVSNEAITHTNYMVQTGEVSHANFGVRYQNLVTYADAKSAAENVAYGYSTAEAVVNAWINSETHRQNIENASFTDFGISTRSNNENRYYFTNIFIKR